MFKNSPLRPRVLYYLTNELGISTDDLKPLDVFKFNSMPEKLAPFTEKHFIYFAVKGFNLLLIY